jgi:hypothetical protein
LAFTGPYGASRAEAVEAASWWEQIQAKQISQKYAVRAEPPADRDWKMRDFVLFDPAGVLWRIA